MTMPGRSRMDRRRRRRVPARVGAIGAARLFGAPRNADLGTERTGADMDNYRRAAALTLTDRERHQRLQSIFQSSDRFATGGRIQLEPELVPAVAGPAGFLGGRAFRFGPFRLFPSQRLLLEGNRPVQIGGRAFDVLTTLVERAGEVVGKDELIALVWPNLFVDRGNLSVQVSAVRQILGKTGAGTGYIVTITGRGYSFVAPIAIVDGAPLDGPDPEQARGHARNREAEPIRSRPELIGAARPFT
jgi:DNA-binding winged helix-turn-helix (wHTH) protein